jgi:hypothetical protein
MARLTTLLVLISLGWMCQAQSTEIKWAKNSRLGWNDFQGRIESTSDHAAKTFSGFKYSASVLKRTNSTEIDFVVYAYFIKDLSWSHSDKRSNTLLGHEQGHFDIAELYARLLRKALAEYPYPKNLDDNVFDDIFNSYQHQRDSVQATYDKDTNHSRFKEGQMLWEKFLAGEINRFGNYADTKVRAVVE